MKKIIYYFCFCLCSLQAKASHIIGGEVAMSIGFSNDVLINLDLYRDCQGVAFTSTLDVTLTSSCGSQVVTLNLVQEVEVGNNCVPSICSGGADPGISKGSYTGVGGWMQACSNFEVTYSSCCRQATINNLQNTPLLGINLSTFAPAIPSFNLTQIEQNNYPQFFLSQNTTTQINFARGFTGYGIRNKVFYELIAAEDELGVPLSYNIGYSPSLPFGNTVIQSLDRQSGIFSVTPTMIGTYSVRVREVVLDENANIFNSSEVEYLFTVVPSSNTAPIISTLNNVITDYFVCVNDTLNIQLPTTDADASDSTFISYELYTANIAPFNNEDSLIVFSAQNALGVLQYIPNGSSFNFLSPLIIYIKVRDNACPVNNTNTYALRIFISNCNGALWPGDCNTDLSCAMDDLFPIGIGFGTTGPVRPSATVNWQAQSIVPWGQQFYFGADYAHADADGDGSIAWSDTNAVLQNLGLQHPLRVGGGSLFSEGELLSGNFNIDTVSGGNAVNFEVALGSATNVLDAIYGISFDLGFYGAAIDSALSSISFPSSFFGTRNTDLIAIAKSSWPTAFYKLGMVRNNQVNASGHGVVVSASIVINDNVSTINDLRAIISNVKAIDLSGNIIPIVASNDSVVVVPNAINNLNLTEQWKIYPNPAKGEITIEGEQPATLIEIFDCQGRLLSTVTQPILKTKIDIDLPGIYVVKIWQKGRAIVKRVSIF